MRPIVDAIVWRIVAHTPVRAAINCVDNAQNLASASFAVNAKPWISLYSGRFTDRASLEEDCASLEESLDVHTCALALIENRVQRRDAPWVGMASGEDSHQRTISDTGDRTILM
jgi:hypothetical protein